MISIRGRMPGGSLTEIRVEGETITRVLPAAAPHSMQVLGGEDFFLTLGLPIFRSMDLRELTLTIPHSSETTSSLSVRPSFGLVSHGFVPR